MVKININTKKTKEWILGSLKIIQDNYNDSNLLGGFSGSVIEFLGKSLNYPNISDSPACFSKFIEKYLAPINQKYSEKGKILYTALRCEGAHAVLAQSGITIIPKEEAFRVHHLKCNEENAKHIFRYSVIIFAPQFIEDLIRAVKAFFADLEKDPTLDNKFQEAFNKIFSEKQNYMEQLVKNGKLRIETHYIFIPPKHPLSY